MTKKNIFLILAIIGFIAPYYFFVQVPPGDATNLPVLIQPLFANNFMKGLAMDLTVSVLAFWTYVFIEGNRSRMKNLWAYPLATALVGLSFALPLFLYFRERKSEEAK
jgi:hypothetical protein